MNHAVQTITQAQQRVAAHGGTHIGDIVSWNAERIDVPRSSARGVFTGAGFAPALIGDLASASALTRAVSEVPRPKGIVVQPFARPKGDTAAAFGVYMVEGRDDESGDPHTLGARVRVDRATGQLVALPPEGATTGIKTAMDVAEVIATRAEHLRSHCETGDISAAMVAAIKTLSGVPLRRWGGFYLLPPTSCRPWVSLKPGLETLGVEVITMELYDAPGAMATASAAAKGALEADLAELLSDLEKAAKDGMQQSAVHRRVATCDQLVAKAELYRGVLAGITDQITARSLHLQAEFKKHIKQDAPKFTVAVRN
jgi:hypothetical protein